MTQLQHLINSGYNKNDISDLLAIFNKQVLNLEDKLPEISKAEIAEEIHRLKGGCDLLKLEQFSKQLSELKINKNDLTLHEAELSNLKQIVSNLLSSIEELSVNL